MDRLCIFKVNVFGKIWSVERLGKIDEHGMATYRIMRERRVVANDYATSGLHLIRLCITLATDYVLDVREDKKP